MKHIFYTTNEGGNYRYTQSDTDSSTVDLYEKLKSDGFIELRYGDAKPKKEYLAFIMLLDEIDNFDFMINQKR